MMLHATTKNVEVFKIQIQNVTSNFNFTTEVSKVEKDVLINIQNRQYEVIINQFQHLKDIQMNDKDTKSSLPMHLILGASEYSKNKVQKLPRIGQLGEPIAELTRLGWVITSPGRELNVKKIMLTRTTTQDYDPLCNLDVLGVHEPVTEGAIVHQGFKDQLEQKMDGRYKTGFIWKPSKDLLPDNKEGSIDRPKALRMRLLRTSRLFCTCEDIICQQVEEGIIEKVEPTESDKKIFYMPHKPVIRQNAESTKVRIVYDTSTRATPTNVSLNDSLGTGSAFQNLRVSLFDQDSDQLYYVGTLKRLLSSDSIGLIAEI